MFLTHSLQRKHLVHTPSYLLKLHSSSPVGCSVQNTTLSVTAHPYNLPDIFSIFIPLYLEHSFLSPIPSYKGIIYASSVLSLLTLVHTYIEQPEKPIYNPITLFLKKLTAVPEQGFHYLYTIPFALTFSPACCLIPNTPYMPPFHQIHSESSIHLFFTSLCGTSSQSLLIVTPICPIVLHYSPPSKKFIDTHLSLFSALLPLLTCFHFFLYFLQSLTPLQILSTFLLFH